MIGEIAAIFHWPLNDLLELDLGDLLRWHAVAVDTHNRMNQTTKG